VATQKSVIQVSLCELLLYHVTSRHYSPLCVDSRYGTIRERIFNGL